MSPKNEKPKEESKEEPVVEITKVPTFDDWLAEQDEATKSLIAVRFTALSNTVKATRDERDALAKQMKDTAKKLEEGSEARKSLEAISAQLEEAERRAAFTEEAIKAEIGCRNPRAAWLLAKADKLFTRNGSPDWDALHKAAPELFGKVAGDATAGGGTAEKLPPKSDMNAWIRARAGRQA